MHDTDGTDWPAFLRGLFDVAVAAADPMCCVPDALPERPEGRDFVVGAGKASARMAEAVEQVWPDVPGYVITRYGYERPTKSIEIVSAAHPVPDAAGRDATREMLNRLQDYGEGDLVIALISGGGSALMIDPAGDITLEEKQAVNAALLASGAPITQMNTVRKHLSRVKGGQLAAAVHPARLITLMISDIPGDDPAFIASGPTVGDDTTPDDALAIADRWEIDLPLSVRAVLGGQTGVVPTSDPRLNGCENIIVAAPSQSLAAAAEAATGCTIDILGDALEGEARDLAQTHATLARDLAAKLTATDKPRLLLSGGECTVTRRGDGIGGPNAEYALALAIALDGHSQIYAIACDTDGVDGAAEVAGATIGPDTLTRATAQGLDAQDYLSRNDAHTFFENIDRQIVPGPTLTNVNDFRAILILPPNAT